MGHFGFSYVGLIFLLMLIVPNVLWASRRPKGYEQIAKNESKVLGVFERAGEVLVTCAALLFSDFNLRAFTLWSLWLVAAFVCMLLYEIYWLRYFRSERTLADFYGSLCGVPVPGATLPVIAFVLLAVYGKNVWLLLAAAIFGVGHIGIHLAHGREM